MARLSGFELALVGPVTIALFGVTNCSDSFSDCKRTRTCPADDAAAGTSAGGNGGSDASGAATTGGSNATVGADGSGVSAGGSDNVDAGDSGLGSIDAGEDAALSCSEGMLDCNRDRSDGCETKPDFDEDHCSGCYMPCSTDGVTARSCVDGVCHAVCDATHADCNQDGRDGCEVDLTSDVDHCGACDRACATTNVDVRACSNGACTPQCSATYGDCITPAAPDADDGCETSIATADQCGACGHSCLGGECANEKCQPLVLGTGLEQPIALTVDDQWVHWVQGGSITGKVVRNSVMGPATSAADLVVDQPTPMDIENDGQYLYWANAGPATPAVVRMQYNTTNVVPVVSSVTNPTFSGVPVKLALDDANVYFVDTTVPTVYKVPKAGGTLTPLFNQTWTPLMPFDIAVDSTHLFIGSNKLLASLTSTLTETILTPATATDVRSIALDAEYVYFDSYIDGPPRRIWRLPKVADTPLQEVAPLPDVTAPVWAMEVSDGKVYLAMDSGIYVADAAEGSSAVPLSSDVNVPRDIAVHGGAIYWVNVGDYASSTGSILKLAL